MSVVARTYATSLVANLPVLALLLVPQLMRSRAGSESMLAMGMVLLLTLVVAAVVVAPEISARTAPSGRWQFGRARSEVRAVIRRQKRAYLWRLGEFVVLYVASQGLGGIIAWFAPYVSSNPDYGVKPGSSSWVIDYPNYAAQAVGIYLVFCFATAWYASRVRQLALRSR